MQDARKQSLHVSQDPAEKEVLEWIEAVSDTEGWTLRGWRTGDKDTKSKDRLEDGPAAQDRSLEGGY